MKPLTSKRLRIYDMIGNHPVQTGYSKSGDYFLIDDVRDAVLKFKQRTWFFVPPIHEDDVRLNCRVCNKRKELIDYNEEDIVICIDCALEQDFGKELTEGFIEDDDITNSRMKDNEEERK